MSDVFNDVITARLWTILFINQKTAYDIMDRDWSSDECSSDLARRIQRDVEVTSVLCFSLLSKRKRDDDRSEGVV